MQPVDAESTELPLIIESIAWTRICHLFIFVHQPHTSLYHLVGWFNVSSKYEYATLINMRLVCTSNHSLHLVGCFILDFFHHCLNGLRLGVCVCCLSKKMSTSHSIVVVVVVAVSLVIMIKSLSRISHKCKKRSSF